MTQYLYNSQVRNCYTQQYIYRLAVKLTPTQWGKVKQYFKFYNFDQLKGWGTIHPYDVVRTLLADESKEYQELTNKIAQAEKDCANANGYLEAEEIVGLITNLHHERWELISSQL